MLFHILLLFIVKLQNACIGHGLELQEERINVKFNDGLLRPVFVGNYQLDPPYLYVDDSTYSFLHYLRFNRIFEYCNEHEHLGKKCHYFYIDIIGEDNDDGKVSTECFKLLFHNPSPAQRVQEKSTNEFAIKELNLGILLEQHLKLAKEKIKCVTVEQGIGKMGEKVDTEISKKMPTMA
ncbi:hypothetical protein niasHT_002828 [Heterodera trifolii]|uniref:Effector protein n=1 Tax=Heterodera trifolii TaxID=157864 RepID=A0ABD2MC97_9BILA